MQRDLPWVMQELLPPPPPPPSKRAKKPPSRFLSTLLQLCRDVPSPVARWSLEEDQRFDVLDPRAFEQYILEYYPKAQTKTFFRQLSHYKIAKENHYSSNSRMIRSSSSNTAGSAQGETISNALDVKSSYSLFHPLFDKNHPERILDIPCTSRKKKKKKKNRRRKQGSDEEYGESSSGNESEGSNPFATKHAVVVRHGQQVEEEALAPLALRGGIKVDEYFAVFALQQRVAAFQRVMLELGQSIEAILADRRFRGARF